MHFERKDAAIDVKRETENVKLLKIMQMERAKRLLFRQMFSIQNKGNVIVSV